MNEQPTIRILTGGVRTATLREFGDLMPTCVGNVTTK